MDPASGKIGREYLFQCDSFFMLWQSAADSVTAFGIDIPRAPPSLENNTKISVTSQMPIIQLQQQQ